MSNQIVFFGSGPVAAESLRLLAQDFEVEAVITKPQPPHHKEVFPVLKVCEELGLTAITADSTQDMSDIFAKQDFNSRLGIVIDHGLLISQDVIDFFEFGIINSHFSLLPRWRGADPISFSILNGDAETGVSLMIIVAALDEGDLIAQKSLTISPEMTTPLLTEELIKLSHELLVETLPQYLAGEITPVPQPTGGATYSRKLTKQDSQLDWNKTAVELEREIRAFTGWPRSRTKLGSTDVIITKAHVLEGDGQPGSLFRNDKQLGIYCSQGVLVIDSLIPAGKKQMPTEAFLAGYQL